MSRTNLRITLSADPVALAPAGAIESVRGRLTDMPVLHRIRAAYRRTVSHHSSAISP